MPLQPVRDIEIYHELHGTGPPVVLISGTGGDLRGNPTRGRGPLERAFRVLMYDQRGLGRSSKPEGPYTMADYADDCAALMEATGLARANVLGISFGGMVAQHLALRHPERIDRLVLACTSSGGAGGRSFDLLDVADLTPEQRIATTLPILDSRNDLTTDPPTLAPYYETFLAAMRAGPLNASEPGAARGARCQLEARATHDTWAQLDQIRAPTLVMGGRYDRQAPVDNVERLANRIPGAQLQVFEGGHHFLLQDPAAWPAVVEFLSSLA
jgi:3-oxoadipate enol-lactonase